MVTKTDSSQILHDGSTIKDVLDRVKPLANYSNLRAYAGAATQVRITDPGISGFFYYDAGDTIAVDNGGTVIVSNNGKRWKRLFDGAVNVKWFGANSIDRVGYENFDSTASFQLAINSTTNIPIYVPAGKYIINGTLNISERTEFTLLGDNHQGYQGNSKELSVLYCKNSTTYTFDLPNSSFATVICFNGVSFDGTNGVTNAFSDSWPGAFINRQSGASWFGLRFKNCSVKGSNVAGTALINTGARFWVDIDDCEIAYATNGVGLVSTGCTTYTVSKTYFHYNRQCFSLTGVATDVAFYKCAFEASTTVAHISGYSVTFQDCHFEHIGYSISGGHSTGVSEKGGAYAAGNRIDTWFNLVRSSVKIVGGYIYDSWPSSALVGVFRLQPYNTPGTYQRGGYLGLFNPGMEKAYGGTTKFNNLFIEDSTDLDGRGNKFTIEVDSPRITNDSSNYPQLLQSDQIRKIDKGEIILHWSNGNMQRQAAIIKGRLRIYSPSSQVLGTRAVSPYMVAYATGDEIVSVGSTSIVAGYKVIKAVSTTLTGAINLSINQVIPVTSSVGITVGDRITISDPLVATNHLGAMTVTAVPDSFSVTVSGTSGTASIGSMVVAHLVQEISADGRYIGTAAPVSGTWKHGDIIQNSAPAAGGNVGWICTAAGTPGTWKAFGTIAA